MVASEVPSRTLSHCGAVVKALSRNHVRKKGSVFTTTQPVFFPQALRRPPSELPPAPAAAACSRPSLLPAPPGKQAFKRFECSEPLELIFFLNLKTHELQYCYFFSAGRGKTSEGVHPPGREDAMRRPGARPGLRPQQRAGRAGRSLELLGCPLMERGPGVRGWVLVQEVDFAVCWVSTGHWSTSGGNWGAKHCPRDDTGYGPSVWSEGTRAGGPR